MREKKCLLANHEICSENINSFYSLRYNQNRSKCFPSANSLIEVLFLYDDRFYQQCISLHSTFVCSIHLQEMLKEYSISSYRKCWLCLSLEKTSPVRLHTNFISLLLCCLFSVSF